jgi:phage protein D
MAGSIAYPVRTPQWILTYQGINVSADISDMVLDITYGDRVGGSASEIEIVLEDHERLWQGPWRPAQGDSINLLMGYRGELLLPCGDFEVDQTELEGPPDVFKIRGLSAYITPAMRTRRSVAYEGMTPAQVAGLVAGLYSLTLVTAQSDAEAVYSRITQRNETDLEFLRRLADEHDYEFSVRGAQLVFYPRSSLERLAPVMTIGRTDLTAFSFVSKTHRTYKSAQVSHQRPSTKQLLFGSSSAELGVAMSDTLKLHVRCENSTQAALRASAALHRANMFAATARLRLEGSTNLSAGNPVTLIGFGGNDGTYLVETARHRLTRDSGYTTEIEARRIS